MINVLQDGNVKLRQFNLSDKKRMTESANNFNIFINLRDAFSHPYTEKDAETFIAMQINQDPSTIFAIEFEDKYVGNIGLVLGTDVYRKSAEIGYFIGEPYWNKGIVTKAVNLITKYGFEQLDVVRIYTGVFDYNKASQRVLEKCGFTKEAVFKNAIFKNGKICNEVRYAKLKED